MTPMTIYEVRPRKDHRGVDLISDALPMKRTSARAISKSDDLFSRVASQFRIKRISVSV
jgi:hypothetical protein